MEDLSKPPEVQWWQGENDIPAEPLTVEEQKQKINEIIKNITSNGVDFSVFTVFDTIKTTEIDFVTREVKIVDCTRGEFIKANLPQDELLK
jgi:hypothetical protein